MKLSMLKRQVLEMKILWKPDNVITIPASTIFNSLYLALKYRYTAWETIENT